MLVIIYPLSCPEFLALARKGVACSGIVLQSSTKRSRFTPGPITAFDNPRQPRGAPLLVIAIAAGRGMDEHECKHW
jgi:hypothetical protein